MPQPTNMQISPDQVTMAAAAGLQILNDRDLKVPIQVAKNGSVGILESILIALNTGQVVLADPSQLIPTPPDGDGEPAPAPDPKGDNQQGPKLVGGAETEEKEEADDPIDPKETESVKGS